MSTTASSLEKIVASCKAQERKGQKLLYEQFYSPMLKVCMQYAKDYDEGVHILNDGFLKVFNGIDKLRDLEKLFPWMKKIMLYTAIDFIRKNRTYHAVIELREVETTSVENVVHQFFEEEVIAKLLLQIAPASKAVFSLYVLEGYSHKEIAKMLAISVGTSKWHLSNARNELKKKWMEFNPELHYEI